MVYARSAWYVAAWSHEMAAGEPYGTTILGEPIVIYRGESGRVHALEDRCVHRLAPLSLGRCEGENLRCMYHGLLFAESGALIQIPGQDLLPKGAGVRRYPAVDRHGWIWVWMGDAAEADETLIPPAVGPENPDWILGTGKLDYAAEARLISDNLTDFSHLVFVHSKSFQVGSEWADMTPKVIPLPRGVRFERWLPNARGPVTSASEALTDGWVAYDYLMPGILIMYSASFPVGTAERFDFKEPDFDLAIQHVGVTSQAITPLTSRTARYFYSTGPLRKFGGEELRDAMVGVAEMAFAEDKVMIEAQQRIVDMSPDARIMPTAHDKGVTLFNRLVSKLAAAEGSPADESAAA